MFGILVNSRLTIVETSEGISKRQLPNDIKCLIGEPICNIKRILASFVKMSRHIS
jgi:hypothetical protein